MPKASALANMELESQSNDEQPRAWYSSSTLLVRIFAVVGLLFLVQKTMSFYTFTQEDRLSFLGGVGGHVHPKSHPADAALIHHVNNTGHSDEHGKKAIVVASLTRENTSWVHEHFPDWQLNIYVVDDAKANMTILRQGGHEATVFLTYIINHYYNLPNYAVFLHAKRYQWHNEDPMFDGVMPVKNLRLPYVREAGYVSLRCTWHPGCPVGVRPAPGHEDGLFEMQGTYADLFEGFFPERTLPEKVGAPCCAQFAVSREQILLRPVHQYERVRQWLWETKKNSGMTGRVLEYMWHILFSMEDVLCEDAETCFCNKFGLCNLDCPDQSKCRGRQYEFPYYLAIPDEWPVKGPGKGAFKKYGWWQEWYPNETFGLEWMDPANKASTTLPAIDTIVKPENATTHEQPDEQKWDEEEVDEQDVDEPTDLNDAKELQVKPSS